MTAKQAAALTGGAVVVGWVVGIAAMYAVLMYGPDMPDIDY